MFGDSDDPFNKILFEQIHSDFKRLEHDHSREKTLSHYEIVTLQTLNFNIKPPDPLIHKHIQSILTMIDKSLDEILDPDSYRIFLENHHKIENERKKEKKTKEQKEKNKQQKEEMKKNRRMTFQNKERIAVNRKISSISNN